MTNTKNNQLNEKKNSVGVYVCLLFFCSHKTLHFIYNMIIFYSRFSVAFSPRICVFECVCVYVYLVWKIALNFYKGFPSFFMFQPQFMLYFFSLTLSRCHSVHIQWKSSTGNQKRRNTKIKRYHCSVHVLLPCEWENEYERKANQLEYSLRRQFVCIRRVRFFVFLLFSFYFHFVRFLSYGTRVQEYICLKSAREKRGTTTAPATKKKTTTRYKLPGNLSTLLAKNTYVFIYIYIYFVSALFLCDTFS